MSGFPQWDDAVEFHPPLLFAIDRASGRRAFRGPLAEGGTPDENTANGAWGVGNFAGWTQPDGAVVYYQPVQGWIEQLLAAIDAPLGLVNDEAISLWMQSEGMPPEANNPCATTARGYGETFRVPYTVPFYPNRMAGQRAWVDSVDHLVPNAHAIIDVFRALAPIGEIYNAIHDSQWCPGCPNYPAALYAVAAPGTQIGPSPGGTSGEPQPPPPPPPPDDGAPGGASVPPADVGGAWEQTRVVVTETLPVATSQIHQIANLPIGG